MAITVIKAELNSEGLKVVIEGKSVSEATSAEARKIAYDARMSSGFGQATIRSETGPYPVDDKVKEEDKQPLRAEDMPELSKRAEDLRYRNEYLLVRPL